MQAMSDGETNPGSAISKRTAVAFVVLRHMDREGTHYDLMIDDGERLATWKFARPPETAQDSPLVCRRIGDHRRIYLEYEGPISGDRGEVRRHDLGRCETEVQSPDRWRVEFGGQMVKGAYELSRISDDAWALRPLVGNRPNPR